MRRWCGCSVGVAPSGKLRRLARESRRVRTYDERPRAERAYLEWIRWNSGYHDMPREADVAASAVLAALGATAVRRAAPSSGVGGGESCYLGV